jgi:predicted nucleic acid-binding protein
VRACGTGSVRPALSDASLKELTEVVERLDRRGQIVSASRAFKTAMDLWSHGTLYHPTRIDWPTVVDRKDHWVLDLAWVAQADFIVSLDEHLTAPTMPFPVEVLEPDQLVARLGL